ncbi:MULTISPECIES: DNA replication/repair protein RecF [unclassified Mesorhizobium]|uniref:DNA replication/repair protein RecF n=1 Tax=unclassified Mesorhizobium TaxID=325217 RepID=UPI000FCAE9AD|nr:MULTISPECIES: DNA replication/repair protein RecF [unclassified Mesorhizobium]RUU56828.1 DNA replication/repair protein RecF [Mesorhizobium sp. M7A.T.Ca.TU.009.01.1.1]RUU84401.1 DNA replication/repair protein RecF [Mesorhizobium sp. M7A.T.Ca.TU.009.01.1.2]TJV22173.1 MAG: DNA replication/repair protein RecF [Mesorhizobium sp.]RUT89135.1 DNA replication/repair protein RecF [Mesorhizobium sp. M7A.T.Ca.US.000.02.1.1]RUT94512.1 DNA replication/repair protein RecF [Mesorhizobium sp. M7A.T.Ca.US.0
MPAQNHISKLTLTNFRNYAALTIDLAPGAVVFSGDNGAGKTNLLEAISLLTPGRGLRRAPYVDVARDGGDGGFALHARLDGPDGQVEIGTGISGGDTAGEGGRRVRINGASARSAEDMLEWLRVVWLTPAMDALFTGPAADRRRFLDRLVLAIDPGHGQRAIDYEKAMRGRNRLLTENSRDDRWFDAIETQMAETGVAIAAARAEMVRLLATMIDRLPDTGPFPRADIGLSGDLEAEIAAAPAVDVEERFRRTLAGGRERDRAAGRTLDGPHRSDLVVRHRPKAMPAELCSTGEQKALLVGIVLSHARLTGEMSGMTPILLLDEIAAHLDSRRRAALFSILEELNCQAFMTGTDAALFSSLQGRAQFLTVDHGTVGPTEGP